jgi:hypothetical protein
MDYFFYWFAAGVILSPITAILGKRVYIDNYGNLSILKIMSVWVFSFFFPPLSLFLLPILINRVKATKSQKGVTYE